MIKVVRIFLKPYRSHYSQIEENAKLWPREQKSRKVDEWERIRAKYSGSENFVQEGTLASRTRTVEKPFNLEQRIHTLFYWNILSQVCEVKQCDSDKSSRQTFLYRNKWWVHLQFHVVQVWEPDISKGWYHSPTYQPELRKQCYILNVIRGIRWWKDYIQLEGLYPISLVWTHQSHSYGQAMS